MSKQTIHNNHHHHSPNSPNYPQQQQQQQPPIQPSTSTGMESLSYSLDSSSEQQLQQQQQYQPDSPTGPYDIKRIHGMGGMTRDHHDNNNHANTAAATGEYNSIYSEEMSRMSAYQQYQEEDHHHQEESHHQSSLPTVNEYNNNTAAANAESEFDATKTVHEMHRKLLHLLSHPELFTDALIWESKLERGLDPSRPDDEDDDVNNVNGGAAGEGGGIKSFENEFGGADEQKDDDTEDDTEGGGRKVNNNDNAQQQQQQQHQKLLPPPLPQQIFAPDAEVVLPQALTATQLFGMERITGIELEAAAGITGLSHLFLRWLALMPEGDHMNIINPPGLTVMRISGGRYRVTAAHRVVWRWMNKFSFSDAMFQSSSSTTTTTTTDAAATTGSGKIEEGSSTTTTDDATDFDFGDLVTMTIIDVFETDIDGKLLSYCPTFDNRAVHKTQQTVERIKKSATQFKQRIEVVKKSPAGQSAQHVAEDLGKRGLSAAFKGFTLVKNRIESELQNRQYSKSSAVLNDNNDNDNNVAVSTASSDAVGGEDIGDESSEK